LAPNADDLPKAAPQPSPHLLLASNHHSSPNHFTSTSPMTSQQASTSNLAGSSSAGSDGQAQGSSEGKAQVGTSEQEGESLLFERRGGS